MNIWTDKPGFSGKLIITIALLITLILLPLTGQEDNSGSTGNLFSLENDSTGTLFGATVVRAETSARIAAWDPKEGIGLIAVRYVYPEGYHQIDDEDFFALQPEGVEGLIFGSTLKAQPVFKDGLAEYFDETTVVIEFRSSPDVGATTLGINALFQICNEEGTCLFPDSNFHEVFFDPASGALEAASGIQDIISWNEQAITAEVSPQKGINPVENRSLLLFLLMAFVGGILLNIMPCVLPLLSVKALSLVKQAGQDRRAILKHSWLYVLGIEVSFWVLAAIVVGLQTSGRLLGWGFQFQSPVFVLILTAIIWVFALSMFDVFVIEAPRSSMQGASAAGARGGYIGSFLTGIFAVLVATPCTAPFLGAALGFAFSQSPITIFAIFSVTGLGLGLPFLLLGIWPKIIEKLPKPGNWMNTFKEVMGFLLFGTAVYLFTTFAKLAPGALDGALWWILILAFSAWLLGRARQPMAKRWFRYVGQIAALLIAVTSGIFFIDLQGAEASAPGRSQSEFSNSNEKYIVFDEADVISRISTGEPVFLEFTAAWCTTCKVNQRVFRDDSIVALMKDKGVTHIKGDLTAYDETLTRWLADFGRAGVPLYVLYRPGDDPHLFPELISVDGLARELEKIR